MAEPMPKPKSKSHEAILMMWPVTVKLVSLGPHLTTFTAFFYQFSMKPIFGQLRNAFSLWREHHVGEKSHTT
jgi:hypothetical protein